MIERRLRDWAARRGYGIAFAGAEVVGEVQRKLEERRAQGLIAADFFAESLSFFRFLEGISVPSPVLIVMVAVPVPTHTVPVTIGGKTIETLLPPTYVRYRATFDSLAADMRSAALPPEAAVETLKAPLKSLAAHMGLVVYGRNNVTYRPGLGSSHQLCGFAVGPAPRSAERGAPVGTREAMLERCRDCRACLKACPTGAIREDRFLISAERCYTLLSESRRPFPDRARLPKSVCLVGCMACQRACPENAGRLKTAPSGIELSEAETEALVEVGRTLGSGPIPAAPGAVDPRTSAAWRSASAKLANLGLTEDIEVMGRNLGLFLRR